MTITRVQNWPFPMEIDSFESVSEYLTLLYRSLQEDSMLRIEDFQSALHGRILGEDNTFLGIDAGYSITTGYYNTLIGGGAGYSVTTAFLNTAIGHQALYNCTAGWPNVAVGVQALYECVGGGYNTAVGYLTLYERTEGTGNTGVGHSAGNKGTTTNDNTYLGAGAGYNHTGSGSLFIGHDAGGQLTSGDNKLYIDNSNTTTPLIYGEFDNDLVRITNRLDLSDTTDNHIIKAVQEEGLGGRLTIGLDETARTMVICDAGDVDADFGTVAYANPQLYLYDATGSEYCRFSYNGFYVTDDVLFKCVKTTTFRLYADLSAGHAFTFNSGIGKELTDADVEQAWLYVEPKVRQTSTANYIGLLMDVTEESTGSGTNELMALRVSGTDKFTVSNTGIITAANYTAANLLTACTSNAGALDFSASSKTLTVADDCTVNQNLRTTDDVTFDDITCDKILANEIITFDEEYNIGSKSANFAIDWNNGQNQKVTITGANLQITFTAPTSGVGMFKLRIIQDDGNDTIDWANCTPVPLFSNNGTAIVLSVGAGLVDYLWVSWNGTNYYIGGDVDWAPAT